MTIQPEDPSTLGYLDPDGNIWYAKESLAKLNVWLSILNGNSNVMTKPFPPGVNRGKVIAELEMRRSKSARGITDRLANLAADFGRAEDWREYENKQGYTHLEELLIYQPNEWRKQTREYFYRYHCSLDRQSDNEEREVEVDGATISLTTPVLVVLLHPEISRQGRYEPLNFLLAYGVKSPLPSLEAELREGQWEALQSELSPLDYFFAFQEHVESYRLDKLQSIGKLSSFPRLFLIKELDFADIVGQRLAKQMIRIEVVNYIWNRGFRKGIGSTRQPLSMIFAGPSGNGKTELAVWLAKLLNKPGDNTYLKVDCGKLTEGNELFGMSGAYQGSKEGSALNNFVLRMSQDEEALGIVLLDEIEKADSSVIHGLYQVIDKGEWTNKKLGEGHTQTEVIRCDNIIFIMTTNAADSSIQDYTASHDPYTKVGEDMELVTSTLESYVRKKLQRTHPFTNAFLGRIGKVVPFVPMARGDPAEHILLGESMTVAKILIEREQVKMMQTGVEPRITACTKHNMATIIVRDAVAENGVRSIQKGVEDRVGKRVKHSLLLEMGGIGEGSNIRFSADNQDKTIDFRAEDKSERNGDAVIDSPASWGNSDDVFG